MQLTAPVKNNHYEIELPSGEHAFEIEVVWNSVPGSYGSCYAGTMSYDDKSQRPRTAYDFRC